MEATQKKKYKEVEKKTKFKNLFIYAISAAFPTKTSAIFSLALFPSLFLYRLPLFLAPILSRIAFAANVLAFNIFSSAFFHSHNSQCDCGKSLQEMVAVFNEFGSIRCWNCCWISHLKHILVMVRTWKFLTKGELKANMRMERRRKKKKKWTSQASVAATPFSVDFPVFSFLSLSLTPSSVESKYKRFQLKWLKKRKNAEFDARFWMPLKWNVRLISWGISLFQYHIMHHRLFLTQQIFIVMCMSMARAWPYRMSGTTVCSDT